MRTHILVMFFWVSALSYTDSAEIENVKFAEGYRFNDVSLRLNNVGLMKYKLVIKAMVAGLYIEENTNVQKVLTDVPKRLEIEYFWALKGKDIVSASEKLLSQNVPQSELKKLKPQIDQIHSLYEDISAGDRYALTYLPGRETYLSLNGKHKGFVPGADFAAAYFSIWLGKKPMDVSLKNQLLRNEP